MISRRTLIANAGLLIGGSLLSRTASAEALRENESPETIGPLTSFSPGKAWLDTAGKPIQAHGGSILRVEDVFYWYGENKEGIVPGSGKWHNGVRCYSSPDLCNWTDLGAIIPAVPDDPSSPLNPSSELDRPHILYNAHTKKFVCWIKIIGKDGQTRTVLTADSVTGPYTLIRSDLHPLGMSAGDFDLVIAPADHKAYQYYERVHSELICADLTEDYTDFTGYYSTHFPHPHPPEVREGPAYFFRNGKHYLATSGTLGYVPNPSEVASADSFHGPWTVLGDLHPSDRSRTSFNSQISSVFKHPHKKDLYIALADRWIPDLPKEDGERFATGDASRERLEAFGKLFTGGKISKDEMQSLKDVLGAAAVNTSVASYVWLPIRFDGDRPSIEWRDEWSLSEFA
jgi:hypothetical protein